MYYESDIFTNDQKEIFRNFYEEKKNLYKRHEKDFNDFNDKYFELANKIKNFDGKNKHEELLQREYKYQYDAEFSYLEKKDNLLIIRFYSGWYCDGELHRLVIIDTKTSEQFSYMAKWFKTIGVSIMVDANNSTSMGYYSDGYQYIYNHLQRITDPESISILKSIPKFKYIPLEKFEKINYYKLYQATDEMLYNYELLLKFGATKAATELMYYRDLIDIEKFKKNKEYLLKNRTYTYIQNVEQERINSVKRKIKTVDVDAIYEKSVQKLQRMHKLYWEYANYIIRIPVDIRDIEKESKKLHHCLYSSRNKYLKEVIAGESLILFVRKKDNLEDPFFTVEIKNNEVVQCRTKNNATNQKVTNVVEEFYEKYKNDIDKIMGVEYETKRIDTRNIQ